MGSFDNLSEEELANIANGGNIGQEPVQQSRVSPSYRGMEAFSNLSDEELEELASLGKGGNAAPSVQSPTPTFAPDFGNTNVGQENAGQEDSGYGLGDRMKDSFVAETGREEYADGGFGTLAGYVTRLAPFAGGVDKRKFALEDQAAEKLLNGSALKEGVEAHGEGDDANLKGYKAKDDQGFWEKLGSDVKHNAAAVATGLPLGIGAAVRGGRDAVRNAVNTSAVEHLADVARDAGIEDDMIERAKEYSQGNAQKMNDYLKALAEAKLGGQAKAKQQASQRMSANPERWWETIAKGAVENAGYTAEFMVGNGIANGLGIVNKLANFAVANAIPAALSAATRFEELKANEYMEDNNGNLIVKNEGDDTGTALVKSTIGGIAEAGIESGTDWVVEHTIGKFGKLLAKPLIKQMLKSDAGKSIIAFSKAYSELGKITGVNSMPVEVLEEDIQTFVDNVLGIDKKSSEYQGPGAAWNEERKSGMYNLKGQYDTLLGLLGVMGLQGGAAFARAQSQLDKENANVDGILIANGVDKETVKSLPRDFKKLFTKLMTERKKVRDENGNVVMTPVKDALSDGGIRYVPLYENKYELSADGINSIVNEIGKQCAEALRGEYKKLGEQLISSDNSQDWMRDVDPNAPSTFSPDTDGHGNAQWVSTVSADGHPVRVLSDSLNGIHIVETPLDLGGGNKAYQVYDTEVDPNTGGEVTVRATSVVGEANAIKAAESLSKLRNKLNAQRKAKSEYIIGAQKRLAGSVDTVIYNTMRDAVADNPGMDRAPDFNEGNHAFQFNDKATGKPKIAFILDNITSPQQVNQKFLHEAGTHIGINKVFANPELKKQFLESVDPEAVADAMFRIAESEGVVDRIANENNVSRDRLYVPGKYRNKVLEEVQADKRMMEEALAWTFEKFDKTPTSRQKMVRGIRNWARKSLGMNLKLNDSDLAAVVSEMQKSVRGEGGVVDRGEDLAGPARTQKTVDDYLNTADELGSADADREAKEWQEVVNDLYTSDLYRRPRGTNHNRREQHIKAYFDKRDKVANEKKAKEAEERKKVAEKDEIERELKATKEARSYKDQVRLYFQRKGEEGKGLLRLWLDNGGRLFRYKPQRLEAKGGGGTRKVRVSDEFAEWADFYDGLDRSEQKIFFGTGKHEYGALGEAFKRDIENNGELGFLIDENGNVDFDEAISQFRSQWKDFIDWRSREINKDEAAIRAEREAEERAEQLRYAYRLWEDDNIDDKREALRMFAELGILDFDKDDVDAVLDAYERLQLEDGVVLDGDMPIGRMVDNGDGTVTVSDLDGSDVQRRKGFKVVYDNNGYINYLTWVDDADENIIHIVDRTGEEITFDKRAFEGEEGNEDDESGDGGDSADGNGDGAQEDGPTEGEGGGSGADEDEGQADGGEEDGAGVTPAEAPVEPKVEPAPKDENPSKEESVPEPANVPDVTTPDGLKAVAEFAIKGEDDAVKTAFDALIADKGKVLPTANAVSRAVYAVKGDGIKAPDRVKAIKKILAEIKRVEEARKDVEPTPPEPPKPTKTTKKSEGNKGGGKPQKDKVSPAPKSETSPKSEKGSVKGGRTLSKEQQDLVNKLKAKLKGTNGQAKSSDTKSSPVMFSSVAVEDSGIDEEEVQNIMAEFIGTLGADVRFADFARTMHDVLGDSWGPAKPLLLPSWGLALALDKISADNEDAGIEQDEVDKIIAEIENGDREENPPEDDDLTDDGEGTKPDPRVGLVGLDMEISDEDKKELKELLDGIKFSSGAISMEETKLANGETATHPVASSPRELTPEEERSNRDIFQKIIKKLVEIGHKTFEKFVRTVAHFKPGAFERLKNFLYRAWNDAADALPEGSIEDISRTEAKDVVKVVQDELTEASMESKPREDGRTQWSLKDQRDAYLALTNKEFAGDHPEAVAIANEMLAQGHPVSSIVQNWWKDDDAAYWPVNGLRLESAADAAALFQILSNPYIEISKVLYLDANRRIVGSKVLSLGTHSRVNKSAQEEVIDILTDIPEGAVGVITSHNHPAGDPRPSGKATNQEHADMACAEFIAKALNADGRLLLLDDIITDTNVYVSLATGSVKELRNLYGKVPFSKEASEYWNPILVARSKQTIKYPPQPWELVPRPEWGVGVKGKGISRDITDFIAEQLSTHNHDRSHIVILAPHYKVRAIVQIPTAIAIRKGKGLGSLMDELFKTHRDNAGALLYIGNEQFDLGAVMRAAMNNRTVIRAVYSYGKKRFMEISEGFGDKTNYVTKGDADSCEYVGFQARFPDGNIPGVWDKNAKPATRGMMKMIPLEVPEKKPYNAEQEREVVYGNLGKPGADGTGGTPEKDGGSPDGGGAFGEGGASGGRVSEGGNGKPEVRVQGGQGTSGSGVGGNLSGGDGRGGAGPDGAEGEEGKNVPDNGGEGESSGEADNGPNGRAWDSVLEQPGNVKTQLAGDNFVPTQRVIDAWNEKSFVNRAVNNLEALKVLKMVGFGADGKLRRIDVMAAEVVNSLETEVTMEMKEAIACYTGWGGFREFLEDHELKRQYDAYKRFVAEQESLGVEVDLDAIIPAIQKERQRFNADAVVDKSLLADYIDLKDIIGERLWDKIVNGGVGSGLYRPSIDCSTAIESTRMNPKFIESVLGAVENVGLRGGYFLDPFAGSGLQQMLASGKFSKETNWTVYVEDWDETLMMRILFPKANIVTSKYSGVAVNRGFYDFAFTAIPNIDNSITGEYEGLSGEDLNKNMTMRGNYARKVVSQLREGGLAVLVFPGEVDKFFGTAIGKIGGRVISTMAVNPTLVGFSNKKQEFPYSTPQETGAITDSNGRFRTPAATVVIVQKDFGKTANQGWNKNLTSVGFGKVEENGDFVLSAAEGYGYYTNDQALHVMNPEDQLKELDNELAKAMSGINDKLLVDPNSAKFVRRANSPTGSGANGEHPNGETFVRDGKLFIRERGVDKPIVFTSDVPVQSKGKGKGKNKEDLEKVDSEFDSAINRIRGVDGKRGIEIQKSYEKIRQALREALASAKAFSGDFEEKRKALNDLYQEHKSKYNWLYGGDSGKVTTMDTFNYGMVSGFISYNEKAHTETLGEIFRGNPFFKDVTAGSVDELEDAIPACISRYGFVDPNRIGDMLGWSPRRVVKEGEARGLLFLDPSTHRYVDAGEYLSGRVHLKYEQAKLAAEFDSRFLGNVNSLVKVLPNVKMIGFDAVDPQDNIVISAKSGIVSDKIMVAFLRKIGVYGMDGLKYNAAAGQWSFPFKWNRVTLSNTANQLFGLSLTDSTSTRNRRIREWLNGIPSVVNRPALPDEEGMDDDEDMLSGSDKKPKMVVDIEATENVIRVLNQLDKNLETFIKSNDQYKREVVKTFWQRLQNDYVPRKYSGYKLNVPGLSTLWRERYSAPDRGYQRDAMAAICCGTDVRLLDHNVGSGKTFEMIGSVMTMLETGKIHKAMITTKNQLTTQMCADFMQMFPAAKILRLEASDFAAGRITTTESLIRDNDWDCVIIPHQLIGRMGVTLPCVNQFIQDEYDRYRPEVEGICQSFGVDVSGVSNDDLIVKPSKTKKAVKDFLQSVSALRGSELDACAAQVGEVLKNARLAIRQFDEVLSEAQMNSAMTFDTLGIDFLAVDEAHYFKSVLNHTNKQNAKTIKFRGVVVKQETANMTKSMLAMTRYLGKLHNWNGGVVFATGTPLSNSFTEVYTLANYLCPHKLQEIGTPNLDAFLNAFCDVGIEFKPMPGSSVVGADLVLKVVNCDPLCKLFHSFTDVALAGREFVVAGRPNENRHILECELSPTQEICMDALEQMYKQVLSGNNKNKYTEGYIINTLGFRISMDPESMGIRDDSHSRSRVLAKVAKRTIDDNPGCLQTIFCNEGVRHPFAYKEMAQIANDTYDLKFGSKGIVRVLPRQANGMRTLVYTAKFDKGICTQDQIEYSFSFFDGGPAGGTSFDPCALHAALERLGRKIEYLGNERYQRSIGARSRGEFSSVGSVVINSKIDKNLPRVDFEKAVDLQIAELGHDPRLTVIRKAKDLMVPPLTKQAVLDVAAQAEWLGQDPMAAVDEFLNSVPNFQFYFAHTFDVYSSIKRALVQEGFQPDEIAMVNSREELEAIQDDLNEVGGKIKVLITGASTQEGANIQRRMKALYHYDILWMPGDMEQRNGRLVRPGNLYDEVDTYYCITKGSLDGNKYQFLMNKQRLIDAIQNTPEHNNMSQYGDGSGLASEIMASAVKDRRIHWRDQLQRKLKDAEGVMSASLAQIGSAKKHVESAQKAVTNHAETLKQLNEKYGPIAKAYNESNGDLVFVDDSGNKYTTNEDIAKYWADAVNKMEKPKLYPDFTEAELNEIRARVDRGEIDSMQDVMGIGRTEDKRIGTIFGAEVRVRAMVANGTKPNGEVIQTHQLYLYVGFPDNGGDGNQQDNEISNHFFKVERTDDGHTTAIVDPRMVSSVKGDLTHRLKYVSENRKVPKVIAKEEDFHIRLQEDEANAKSMVDSLNRAIESNKGPIADIKKKIGLLESSFKADMNGGAQPFPDFVEKIDEYMGAGDEASALYKVQGVNITASGFYDPNREDHRKTPQTVIDKQNAIAIGTLLAMEEKQNQEFRERNAKVLYEDNFGSFNFSSSAVEDSATMEDAKRLLPQLYGKKEVARILANLQKHYGTPWFRQAVHSLRIRKDALDIMAGREPAEKSKLMAPQAGFVRDYLKRGWNGVEEYLIVNEPLSEASKCLHAVNSSYLDCDPTDACARFCYAVKGNFAFPAPAVKSELVSMFAEKFPKKMARIIFDAYRRTVEYHHGKALRMFDKGDIAKNWVQIIKLLNGYGLTLQVFSKRAEFLRQVNPKRNQVMLSVDSSSFDVGRQNPDLPLSIVYTGSDEDIAYINEMRSRFEKMGGVILPISEGGKNDDEKRAILKERVERLPKWISGYTCPISSGRKEIGIHIELGEWNCTECDMNSGNGMGCFHKRTSAILNRLILKPTMEECDEIEELIRRAADESGKQRLLDILDRVRNAIRKDGGPEGPGGKPKGTSGTHQGASRAVEASPAEGVRFSNIAYEGARGLPSSEGAKAMYANGDGSEKIFRDTGWWRGRDGKWRYELPSKGKKDEEIISRMLMRYRDVVKEENRVAKENGEGIRGAGYVESLVSVMSNYAPGEAKVLKKLLSAYPKLEDMIIIIGGNGGGGGAIAEAVHSDITDVNGNKNRAPHGIRLYPRFFKDSPSEQAKNFIHELQHNVQAAAGVYLDDEGGFRNSAFKDKTIKQVVKDIKPILGNMGFRNSGEHTVANGLNWLVRGKASEDYDPKDYLDRYGEELKSIATKYGFDTLEAMNDAVQKEADRHSAFAAYELSPWEAESRLASTRLFMTDEERKSETPWMTMAKMLVDEGYAPEQNKWSGNPEDFDPNTFKFSSSAVAHEETEDKKDGDISFANDPVKGFREKFGLGGIQGLFTKKDTQTQEGAAALYGNPEQLSLIIDAVNKTPRALTDEETLAVGMRIVDMERRYAELTEKAEEATKNGNTELVAQYRTQAQMIEDEMTKCHTAMKRTGTVLARAMRARRFLLDNDLKISSLIGEMSMYTGRKPTEEERAALTNVYNQLEKAIKDKDAAYVDAVAKMLHDLIGKKIANLRLAVTRHGKVVNAGKIELDYEDALKQLQAWKDVSGGTLVGMPGAKKWVTALLTFHVAAGVTDVDEAIKRISDDIRPILPQVTDHDIRQAITDYGIAFFPSQDPIAKTVRDLRSQMRILQQIEDINRRILPKKTGIQRDEPTQEQRDLIKQRNELMKLTGLDTKDGAERLKTRLASLKTRLKNQIEDLSKAIKTRTPIKDNRSPIPLDWEARLLMDERDILQKEYDELFKISEEEALAKKAEKMLKILEKAKERAIKRLEDIRSGKYPVKEKPFTNDAIQRLRDEIDAINRDYRATKDQLYPEGTPEEIAARIATRMLALKKLEEAWQNKLLMAKVLPDSVIDPIRTARFKKPRSPELDRMEKEVDAVRQKVLEMREEWKRMNRPFAKALDTVEAVAAIPRVFRTMIDLSATMAQGAFMFARHPIYGFHALKNSVLSFFSEENSDKIRLDMQSDPDFADFVDMGGHVYGREIGSDTVLPEEFRGIHQKIRVFGKEFRFAQMPGVEASERSFGTFLNTINLAVYKALKRHGNFGDGGPTEEQKKDLANFINVASGYGYSTGGTGFWDRLVSISMWAPRYAVSGIKMAVGQPVLAPFLGGNIKDYTYAQRAQVSKLLAREYVGGMCAMAAITLLVTLLAGRKDPEWLEEVLDPRSTNFLNARIGNTNLSFFGPIKQWWTFMARMITGKTVVNGVAKDARRDVTIGKLTRSKASPVVGTALDLITGKTFINEEIRWDTFPALEGERSGYGVMLEGTFVPLSITDIYDAVKENDLAQGLMLAPFILLGAGKNTYALDEYARAIEPFKALEKDLKEIREQGGSEMARTFVERNPILKKSAKVESLEKTVKGYAKKIKNLEKAGKKPPEILLKRLEDAQRKLVEFVNANK